MKPITRVFSRGLLFAALVIGGCGKPVEKSEVKKDPAAALVGKKWVGAIDGQPVEMTFTKGEKETLVDITYTYFGKPGIQESGRVEISTDSTVVLTGRSYKVMAGPSDFRLDTLTGRLSADGAVIAGGVTGQSGAFSVSSTTSLAEIDPPLDMKTAVDALVAGKWEGRMGNKPAKLVVKKSDERLTGQFTYGNAKVNVRITLAEDGTLDMKAQERPSAQGLVIESFSGRLTRGFTFLYGVHETEIKQGFVTSSYEDQWALQNKKKP